MGSTPQTYYRVTGAHKITGQQTSLYVPAETEGAALERATLEGIKVESVLLEQPPNRPLQYSLRSLLIVIVP